MFSSRTLQKASANAYPELDSRFKAAAMKPLVFWLADKTRAVAGDDPEAKRLAVCAWALADFYHILDAGGLILTPEQVQKAQR